MIRNKKAYAAVGNTGNVEVKNTMGTGNVVAHRHDYAERKACSPIYRCFVGTRKDL